MVKHKDLRFGKKKKKFPSGSYFQERKKEQNPERKLMLRITDFQSRNVHITMGKVTMRYDQISQGFLTGKSEDHFFKN